METRTSFLGSHVVRVGITSALVVAILALCWILLAGSDDAGSQESAADPGSSTDGARAPALEHTDEPAANERSAQAIRSDIAAPPSPVDLESCDRERDLFGVVVDSSGAPIPGAEVGVVATSDAYDPPPTISATDGSFWLEIGRGRTVTLVAAKPGYATTGFPSRQAGERVRLVLEIPGRLAFSIRDGGEPIPVKADASGLRLLHPEPTVTGPPIAGAVVRTWRYRTRADDEPTWRQVANEKDHRSAKIYDARSAVTAADGSCVLEDLAPGIIWLAFEHPERGLAYGPFVKIHSGRTSSIHVELPTGRVLRGRVEDANTGQPIAGAMVASDETARRTVTTGPDGRYEFPGFLDSEYVRAKVDIEGDDRRYLGIETATRLTAIATGYARERQRIDSDGDVNFKLKPEYDAIGRVVAATGQPIEGAWITARTIPEESGIHNVVFTVVDDLAVQSLEDGRFRLARLRQNSKHYFVVAAEGHGARKVSVPRGENHQRIDLGDVVLPEARSIAGVAMDPDGTAMPGVEVLLYGDQADRGCSTVMDSSAPEHVDRHQSRRTDDLGRFRFVDLSPGDYRVVLSRPGHLSARSEIVVPFDRDVENVELQLPGRLDLAVRVVSEAGLPVPGALVVTRDYTISEPLQVRDTSWDLVPLNRDGTPLANRRKTPSVTPNVTAKSDSTGLAVLEGLSNSELTVEVIAPDGVDAECDPLHAFAGGPEVRAVLLASSIQGRVVDTTGAPVPGMALDVVSGASPRDVPLDTDGGFRIRVKAGETIDLVATGRSTAMTIANESPATTSTLLRGELRGITSPAKDLTLIVRESRRTNSIAVRVLAPDGTAVQHAPVSIEHSDSPRSLRSHWTGSDGRVRFDGLEDGTYTVVASPGPSDYRIPRRPEGQRRVQLISELEALISGASAAAPATPPLPPILPSQPVVVVAGGPEATLTLRLGIEFVVLVVDAAGNPAPEMTRVGIAADSDFMTRLAEWEWKITDYTDDSGRARLFLPPGARVTVTVTSTPAGGRTRIGTLYGAVVGQGEVTLKLPP